MFWAGEGDGGWRDGEEGEGVGMGMDELGLIVWVTGLMTTMSIECRMRGPTGFTHFRVDVDEIDISAALQYGYVGNRRH